MRLRVAALRDHGPNIREYILEQAQGLDLPAIAPGDHLELIVRPAGTGEFMRQYSLVNYVPEGTVPPFYRLGIQRETAGRGGSMWLHDNLQIGSEIDAFEPRNLFRLDEGKEKVLLVAGGIGITPILSMALACEAMQRPFDLHFFCRDATTAPFLDDLRSLVGGRVFLHGGLPPRDVPIVLERILRTERPGEPPIHVCGPTGLLDVAINTAIIAGWTEDHIRYERFSTAPLKGDRPFVAILIQRGLRVEVGADESLLDALRRHDVDLPSSCRTGTCGTCLTMVLHGEVDHRDEVLSPEEKAENTMMCACVSRAKGTQLVLDL